MTAADREGLRDALADDIADILLEGGALSPRHFADRLMAGAKLSDLRTLADTAAQAVAERDEARALNRDLHRRTQKAERFRARWGGSAINYVTAKVKADRARRVAQAEVRRLSAEVEARDEALKAGLILADVVDDLIACPQPEKFPLKPWVVLADKVEAEFRELATSTLARTPGKDETGDGQS